MLDGQQLTNRHIIEEKILQDKIRKEVIKLVISLKAARVNAGLTQEQAAKALGVKKGTILNYEKYRTKPSIEMAKNIAALYGCTIDDIIFSAE